VGAGWWICCARQALLTAVQYTALQTGRPLSQSQAQAGRMIPRQPTAVLSRSPGDQAAGCRAPAHQTPVRGQVRRMEMDPRRRPGRCLRGRALHSTTPTSCTSESCSCRTDGGGPCEGGPPRERGMITGSFLGCRNHQHRPCRRYYCPARRGGEAGGHTTPSVVARLPMLCTPGKMQM
jgi:hypothetical protein